MLHRVTLELACLGRHCQWPAKVIYTYQEGEVRLLAVKVPYGLEDRRQVRICAHTGRVLDGELNLLSILPTSMRQRIIERIKRECERGSAEPD